MLSSDYVTTLLSLLREDDKESRKVAIISIAKLSSNSPGNEILASTDAFQLIYSLLFHPKDDKQNTLMRNYLENQDELIKYTKVALKNLYFSSNSASLKKVSSISWEEIEKNMTSLKSFDESKTAVFDSLSRTVLSCTAATLFGSIWGTLRHTIRDSSSFQSNALKRGLRSGLGAASIVALYKLINLLDEYFFIQNDSTFVCATYGVGSTLCKIAILYPLLSFAPYSLVPGLFGIVLEPLRTWRDQKSLLKYLGGDIRVLK